MRAVDEQLALQTLLDDGRGVHRQFHADHRAANAYVLDQRPWWEAGYYVGTFGDHYRVAQLDVSIHDCHNGRFEPAADGIGGMRHDFSACRKLKLGLRRGLGLHVLHKNGTSCGIGYEDGRGRCKFTGPARHCGLARRIPIYALAFPKRESTRSGVFHAVLF